MRESEQERERENSIYASRKQRLPPLFESSFSEESFVKKDAVVAHSLSLSLSLSLPTSLSLSLSPSLNLSLSLLSFSLSHRIVSGQRIFGLNRNRNGPDCFYARRRLQLPDLNSLSIRKMTGPGPE